jgi:hypothetical protein
MRVGNKKPNMTVKTTVSVGKPSKTEDAKAHVADGSKNVIGGKLVHGMALMSAAAPKVKH